MIGAKESIHVTYHRYWVIWWHWRVIYRYHGHDRLISEGATLRRRSAEDAATAWVALLQRSLSDWSNPEGPTATWSQ